MPKDHPYVAVKQRFQQTFGGSNMLSAPRPGSADSAAAPPGACISGAKSTRYLKIKKYALDQSMDSWRSSSTH